MRLNQRVRAGFLGDGRNKFEGGRPFPRCIENKQEPNLVLFNVGNARLQLKHTEWRTKDE